MPFDFLKFDNVPVTKELQIIIYISMIIWAVSFLYKNIIKDIIQHLAKRKENKSLNNLTSIATCDDKQVLEHQIFIFLYRYIKVELQQFPMNSKKDMQFYLLGKSIFITTFNVLSKISQNATKGFIIINGKQISNITYKDLSDLQSEITSLYTSFFINNGGKQLVLQKYNEYNKLRASNFDEVFSHITSQDFFKQNIKNAIVVVFNMYYLYMIQAFEDLRMDYKKLNGELDETLKSFQATPELKTNLNNLSI